LGPENGCQNTGFPHPNPGLPPIKPGPSSLNPGSQVIPRFHPVSGALQESSEFFEQQFGLPISRIVESDARETVPIPVCPGARRCVCVCVCMCACACVRVYVCLGLGRRENRNKYTFYPKSVPPFLSKQVLDKKGRVANSSYLNPVATPITWYVPLGPTGVRPWHSKSFGR
jgi:hypothetical protein